MSGRFRSAETTAISLPDDPNVIRIKDRLDLRGQALIEEALIPGEAANDNGIISALMLAYIADWAGPDFDGMPCTPENIMALPFDDPLVEKAHNEIAKRYGEWLKQRQARGNAVSSAGSKS